jgi:hypothetical protein
MKLGNYYRNASHPLFIPPSRWVQGRTPLSPGPFPLKGEGKKHGNYSGFTSLLSPFLGEKV